MGKAVSLAFSLFSPNPHARAAFIPAGIAAFLLWAVPLAVSWWRRRK